MVGIKLKLSTSSVSITSTNDENAASDSKGGPSPHIGAEGGTARNDDEPVAGPSDQGPLRAADGRGQSNVTSSAGNPSGTSGTSTPNAGKRKKGATAAKGTTSRKSLAPSKMPVQGAYSNKRQKRDAAPTTSTAPRPSAIPAHVLSTMPSTPVSASTSSGSPSPSVMAPPPLPSPSPHQVSSPLPGSGQEYGDDASEADTPATPAGSDVYIKDEPFDSEDVDMVAPSPDPLSTPMTPADESSSYPFRGRTGGKVNRLRKPLKVLAEKIFGEMVKKDDYDLFTRPVSTEEYPDYWQVIGGPENAMDIGTMRDKLDSGEYRTLDDIEADMRKLVTAAQTYNPPGTKPHTSAGRMLQHGLKHIERSRAIVMTPSPSPPRHSSTPWRGGSVASGREATQPPNTAALNEDGTAMLPPKSYIPVEMLSYPPNSLEGRAVAWSLTGGKRVWAKREIRAREKFSGRWRRWGVDGSREVDDMDDMDDIFYASRMDAPRGMNPYTTSSNKVRDYTGTDPLYWEWQGFGGATGQPPVPFTQFPLRPHAKEKQLQGTDFGVQPQIEAELARARNRPWVESSSASANPAANGEAGGSASSAPAEAKSTATWGTETNDADIIDRLFDEAMNTKREPFPSRPWHHHYVEQAGLTSHDWLVEMAGGLKGVAYVQSLKRFADGARESVLLRSKMQKSRKWFWYDLDDQKAEGLRALDDRIAERCSALSPLPFSTPVSAPAPKDAQMSVSSASCASIRPAIEKLFQPGYGWERNLGFPGMPFSQQDTRDRNVDPELRKRINEAQFRHAMRFIQQPSDFLDFAPLFRSPAEFHRDSGLLAAKGREGAGNWVGEAIKTVNAALLEHLVKEEDREREMLRQKFQGQAAKRAEEAEIRHGGKKGGKDAAKGDSEGGAENGIASATTSPLTPVPTTEGADEASKSAPAVDPFAHTLQLLDQSVVKPEELSLLINHADIHIPPPYRIGAICKKWPNINSASQRPLPRAPKSEPGKEAAAAAIKTTNTDKASESDTPKQLFPVDIALIRLELIALAKHYALPGVQKFTKEDAVRLLPAAIHRFLAEGGDEA